MNGNRIGILCSSVSLGGLELNTIRLAVWLRESGWKPVLLLSTESPMVPQSQLAGVEYVKLPAAKGPGRQWKRVKALAQWIKATKAGILLTSYNKDLAIAGLCKRFFTPRLKLVYQQQMRIGVPKRDIIHTLRYAMLDAWISPLPYLKEEVLQMTRVPARKVHVIPLGMEEAQFMNPETGDQQAARQSLGLPPDGRFIGILGRLDRNKGQDFVLRLVQQWNKSHHHQQFGLVLMGNATPEAEGQAYLQELKQYIADNALQDAVFILPHRQDVQLFFRAVDIFAMPSYFETYGMVTIEAMAAGLPVIGANAGGTAALLEEGKLGFLYHPTDDEDFLRQLEALIQKKGLLQMLQQARETVTVKYSKTAMIAAYDALLKSL